MQNEEHRVQPLLRWLTAGRVHDLVFCHEQARQRGEERVPGKARGAGRYGDGEGVAGEHAGRIYRVTDALPARQASAAMKVQLVDQHGDCLQNQRERQPLQHCLTTLRSTAPERVSPGPNAKLTTSCPSGTAALSAMRFQT